MRTYALTSLILAVALAGCEPIGEAIGLSRDTGYTKVVYQKRVEIGAPARPEAPPVVGGFAAAPAAAGSPQLPADAPAGVTQDMVDLGAEQYATLCTACHGPAGAGTPAGPALNDADWIHIGGSYDEIVAIIQAGVPQPRQFPAAMPPLGGGSFTEEQVRAMAAYLLALSQGS